MKKIFPYILIVMTIVQLFAPFTLGSGVKNNLEVRANKAEATDSISLKVVAENNDTTITLYAAVNFGENGWMTSDEKVVAIITDSNDTVLYQGELVEHKNANTDPLVRGKMDNILGIKDFNGSVYKKVFTNLTPETTYKISTFAGHNIVTWWTLIKDGGKLSLAFTSGGLLSGLTIDGLALEGANYSGTALAEPNPLSITTSVAGETGNVSAGEQVALNDDAMLPTCELMSAGTWGGCIGRVLYWAVFKPTSYIFALTGRLLDVSVDYSTKDTSYRSSFVVEGWGVVRDFCNMFFIFILLYIAIGTILNLHSVKTKEMIISVVIIGLLMNFSLFATQVIIDTSNILTRVFYNSSVIKIGPMDNGIIKNQVGSQGEIQLSLALVGKINPQRLIMDAGKANDIPTKQNVANDSNRDSQGVSASTFILVVILASIVNIVGIITFLMSSLIFITRVIGLWLAMIFAPLAFFTYTVPSMQEWETVGWKKWWPETIKLAFLAPVFVFFMYLIIKFLETGLGLVINDSKEGLDFILGIFVPFIFIMILLTKAKDIAKDMSGKLGQTVTKAVSAVGGVALGAGLAVATGGAAMAMRGTLGRAGSAIANSETLKRAEARGIFGAKTLRNIGSTAGKGSFDIRGSKLGSKAIEGLGKGLETKIDAGKAKEGGFVKARAENVEKRQKRAKELEVGEDSPETQAIRHAEHELHALKTDRARQDSLLGLNNGIAFDQRPAAIATATANLAAATTARAALPPTAPPGTAAAEQIRLADLALNEANAALISARVADSGLGGLERAIATAERALGVEERALKDAETTLLSATPAQKAAAQVAVNTARGNRDIAAAARDNAKNNLEARQTTIRAQERPVHIAEDNLKRAENIKIEANNQTRHNYAHTIQGGWSQSVSFIVSGGQHSFQGEREAANKILSDVKESQKINEHH